MSEAIKMTVIWPEIAIKAHNSSEKEAVVKALKIRCYFEIWTAIGKVRLRPKVILGALENPTRDFF